MWLGVMLDMLASVLDKHASVLDKLASPEEIFDNSCLSSRNLHCFALQNFSWVLLEEPAAASFYYNSSNFLVW